MIPCQHNNWRQTQTASKNTTTESMDVTRSSTPLNAANTANPVSQHFDELRREMDTFLVHFNHWIDERRRTLTDEKEMCQRTVQEERDTVEALRRQHQQLLAKKQTIINGIFYYICVMC